MGTKRAAVVVGVNTTGELTPLESAAAAADDVAAWLKAEGFDIVKLTDAAKPVTAAAVRKAVTKFVKAGTYEQLVLYFSGHGYWRNNGELWLLSDAPGNADEAVSWLETIELARDSGIPHVVVISDACRSIPNTTTGMRVRGSVVFPNNPTNTKVQPKIDKLQASTVGAPAYEVALSKTSKAKTSVFTHCLREAYTNPDADMVLKVAAGKRTLEVVPNRRLETFLRREVPAVLTSVNVAYQQQPVIDVLSDEPAYIGQVRRPVPGGATTAAAPAAPQITVNDVARAAVVAEISPAGLPIGGLQRVRRGAAASASKQLSAMRSTIEAPHPVKHFESWTGFTVSGADVRGAVAGKDGRLDRAGDEHPNEAAVRIWMDTGKRQCSVAITFGDGNGTVLPALHGYIGHITVAGGGVSNVSYVPSDNSDRWPEYLKRKNEIDRLRSAVSAAVSLGTLRLGKEHAPEFADRVRVQKQFDPTLGLYAAYAYAEAGLYDEVRSLRNYMFEDLRVSLFDVAMLDRTSAKADWIAKHGVVPFCPMLSQGWYYLRPRGMKVPKVLESAQDELIQSLWTTFNKKHMRLISKALREGEAEMNLLLIHGIAQGGKNPKDLERDWLKALAEGLKKSKLTMPANVNVLFPYYADELDKFVAQFNIPTGDQVTAKGGAMDNDYAQFRAQMVEDMRKQAKIPVEQVKQEAGPTVAAEKGFQNWKWVLATLRVLDKRLPNVGSWTIETFLRDVFLYTRRQAVQNTIDKIVTDTMNDSPTVIVGHSLGSVVAYNVAVNRKPSVTTLLLTVGSPLGLPAVRSNLVPLKNPSGNRGWANAYDPRDVVALYPLDKKHFGVSPAITNHGKVDNWTDNRHGIVGYLDDKLVAKTIHACLS